jgi:hypothetical protein
MSTYTGTYTYLIPLQYSLHYRIIGISQLTLPYQRIKTTSLQINSYGLSQFMKQISSKEFPIYKTNLKCQLARSYLYLLHGVTKTCENPLSHLHISFFLVKMEEVYWYIIIDASVLNY